MKLDQEQAKTLQYPFAGQLSRVNNGIDLAVVKMNETIRITIPFPDCVFVAIRT